MISWFQIANGRFNYLRAFFTKRHFMVYRGKLTIVGLIRGEIPKPVNDNEFIIPNV